MSKVKVADHKTDRQRGVDHIGVSVNFVVHNGNGKILLHQRGPGCRDEHGAWDTGGGAIEFGETLEDALRRELMEELCIKPLKIEFLGTYDAHRKNQEVQTHWIAIEYAVQVDPKTVKNGEPHKISALGWFTSKNLPSPLHSQFPKAFAAAQKAGIVK